jgi:hypothetical protein
VQNVKPRMPTAFLFVLLALLLTAYPAWADISRFVGRYEGTAEVVMADGTSNKRDMSVHISDTGKGRFAVNWTSVIHEPDGKSRSKSYQIEFQRTRREGVYSAAMKRDVFGNSVPLNPMKGEPYVWARIIGDTLTVFSLMVKADGGYDLQQFDRTLAEGGLDLDFQSIDNGQLSRRVSTFLKKV